MCVPQASAVPWCLQEEEAVGRIASREQQCLTEVRRSWPTVSGPSPALVCSLAVKDAAMLILPSSSSVPQSATHQPQNLCTVLCPTQPSFWKGSFLSSVQELMRGTVWQRCGWQQLSFVSYCYWSQTDLGSNLSVSYWLGVLNQVCILDGYYYVTNHPKS